MPLKWKIFFALNITLALPAFIIMLLLLIQFFTGHYSAGSESYFYPAVFVTAMITHNGFSNIYILQRYFPDKTIPSPIRTLNVISLLFNILISIGILILCIVGAKDEFSSGNTSPDSFGKILLAILFSAWIVQVVVLLMQIRLPLLIARNNKKKIITLIDSIGQ